MSTAFWFVLGGAGLIGMATAMREHDGGPATKAGRILAVVGLLVVLAASAVAFWPTNESTEMQITFPNGTPPETIETVASVMSQLGEHCPGFLKYRHELEFQRVEPETEFHLGPGYGLPEWINLSWVTFLLPSDADVPHEYYANGHTLYLGVESTGKAILLSKRATQAIFLDQPISRDADSTAVIFLR